MKVRPQILSREIQSWLTFYFMVSGLILSVVIFSQVPNKVFRQYMAKQNQKKLPKGEFVVKMTAIENKFKNKKEEHDKLRFISNKTVSGSGKLTKSKGYVNRLGNDDPELKLMGGGSGDTSSKAKKNNKKTKKNNTEVAPEILSNFDAQYIIRLLRSSVKKRKKRTKAAGKFKFTKDNLPWAYEKNKKFTMSFDSRGNLTIPTIRQKHYEYFQELIQKFKYNWAPPGGQPYPVFGDSYFQQNPVPGRSTYRTFPKQVINWGFTLDENGKVIDVRIIKSMKYKALDDSITESILQIGTFKAPPKDLLENDHFIFLINLYLY